MTVQRLLYPLTDLWYNTAKLNWIHFFSFYSINRMENMDPVWLCCTISLSEDITLSFLIANVSIKDAIVLS